MVEHSIKTAKARFQAIMAHLCVFKPLPNVMVLCLVSEVTNWMNTFHSKASSIVHYSPCMVITGHKLDWHYDCKTEYGQAIQAHDHLEGIGLSNTEKMRTTSAICCVSMNNSQEGYYFLNLNMVDMIT